MSVATGELVTQIFTTANPATSAAVDADSLPTGALWIDGVVNAATVTITNLAGTGVYSFAVTMPTLTLGQRVQVVVSATVLDVALVGAVWGDQCTLLATQASVDDLPTNSELATALAAADDATLAAIAALNNLSAQQTVDAVHNLVATGATTSVGDKLDALPSAVDDELRAAHGTGSWEGYPEVVYPGSSTGYYTDTVDDGASPLDGVRVQLYTGTGRVGLAYEAYTNALGVFEMWPDPGTYYRWLDLAGYSFTQDVEVEVTEP